MVQKLKWCQLSEEGKRFVSAFGYNEETIDYVEDTKNKTTIVLKNKEKVIFNWDKIHRSAR
jgi:hypothetical protein